MKQFIVINAETANKCWVWSWGSPDTATPSVLCVCCPRGYPSGKGSRGTPAPEGPGCAVFDRVSATLLWRLRMIPCLISPSHSPLGVFVSAKDGGGGTDPGHHCYSCHNHFNFRACEWQVTHPSPSRYGPCGVVIGFLDDFLFKSAVLLIFQMK